MGVGGGQRVWINHKNIGFLSNTGPDPLKNHKATKPAFTGYTPFNPTFITKISLWIVLNSEVHIVL